jgi:hypothetical protein
MPASLKLINKGGEVQRESRKEHEYVLGRKIEVAEDEHPLLLRRRGWDPWRP